MTLANAAGSENVGLERIITAITLNSDGAVLAIDSEGLLIHVIDAYPAQFPAGKKFDYKAAKAFFPEETAGYDQSKHPEVDLLLNAEDAMRKSDEASITAPARAESPWLNGKLVAQAAIGGYIAEVLPPHEVIGPTTKVYVPLALFGSKKLQRKDKVVLQIGTEIEPRLGLPVATAYRTSQPRP